MPVLGGGTVGGGFSTIGVGAGGFFQALRWGTVARDGAMKKDRRQAEAPITTVFASQGFYNGNTRPLIGRGPGSAHAHGLSINPTFLLAERLLRCPVPEIGKHIPELNRK
jgi:hypothetical protein